MATCTIHEYDTLTVKEVITNPQTGRTSVRIEPTTDCPGGVFSNSHTIIQKDSSISKPTLQISTKLRAPVLMIPSGGEKIIVKQVDPVDVPKASSFGFFSFVFVIALIAGGYWLYRRLMKANEEEGDGVPSYTKSRADFEARQEQSRGTSSPTPPTPHAQAPTQRAASPQPTPQYTAPQTVAQPAPQSTHTTTIINNDSGNGILNTLATVELMRELDRPSRSERVEVYHDREVIREKETVREAPQSFSNDSDDDDNTSSNDSSSSSDDSSYSSDDSSSSSDDSSSSSDDSGSSFSSDD